MLPRGHYGFLLICLSSVIPLWPKNSVGSLVMLTSIALVSSISPDFDIVIPYVAHRGFTHSIFIPILILLVGFSVPNFSLFGVTVFCYSLFIFLGYSSHIAIDIVTGPGVYLFNTLVLTGKRVYFESIFESGNSVHNNLLLLSGIFTYGFMLFLKY